MVPRGDAFTNSRKNGQQQIDGNKFIRIPSSCIIQLALKKPTSTTGHRQLDDLQPIETIQLSFLL